VLSIWSALGLYIRSQLLGRAPENSYWRQLQKEQDEVVKDGERTVCRCGCGTGKIGSSGRGTRAFGSRYERTGGRTADQEDSV
jgi:hypothetical protein